VASNMLIHREYTNAFPAKLIIEYGQVRTENSNKPHGFGILRPDTFTPFPKNPIIGAFFREIHRADELGSGMRKLMQYGKTYGGADPELIEGDVFRIVVKVPKYGEQEPKDMALKAGSAQVTAQVEAQVEAQVDQRILLACVAIPLSSAEIAVALGHKQLSGNLRKALLRLRKAGLLEYIIPDKPTSRLQKYRLTDAGKHLLASIQNEAEST